MGNSCEQSIHSSIRWMEGRRGHRATKFLGSPQKRLIIPITILIRPLLLQLALLSIGHGRLVLCFLRAWPTRAFVRCRHVACHGSANRSLPPSPRTAAQPGWPAQEVHVGLDELSVCDRSRGALRFVVLLCSCPSRAVPVGVWRVKIIII